MLTRTSFCWAPVYVPCLYFYILQRPKSLYVSVYYKVYWPFYSLPRHLFLSSNTTHPIIPPLSSTYTSSPFFCLSSCPPPSKISPPSLIRSLHLLLFLCASSLHSIKIFRQCRTVLSLIYTSQTYFFSSLQSLFSHLYRESNLAFSEY